LLNIVWKLPGDKLDVLKPFSLEIYSLYWAAFWNQWIHWEWWHFCPICDYWLCFNLKILPHF